jgi:hypothetical protein
VGYFTTALPMAQSTTQTNLSIFIQIGMHRLPAFCGVPVNYKKMGVLTGIVTRIGPEPVYFIWYSFPLKKWRFPLIVRENREKCEQKAGKTGASTCYCTFFRSQSSMIVSVRVQTWILYREMTGGF